MTLHAYMMVSTNIDPAEFVAAARQISGVVAAHALFGPLDAIVTIEAKDFADLEEITGNVHRLPGLQSGDTRIARSV